MKCFLLVLFLFAQALNAQWVQTGLTGKTVSSFAVSNNNFFARTDSSVYLSTNNGTSWVVVNAGLPQSNKINALVVSNTNLFAGTDSGIFLSTNNGTSWSQTNTGLTNTVVLSFAVLGTNIFAGTDGGGVFLSTNNGTTWTVRNTGLTNTVVLSFAVLGANLFAGTKEGYLFLSANNGISWSAVNPNIPSGWFIDYSSSVNVIAVRGTNLFAGVYNMYFDLGGLFLSTNNGTNWAEAGFSRALVTAFAVSGTNLFAGSWSGVFLSTNNGASWTDENLGIPTIYNTPHSIASIVVHGGYLYAGIPNEDGTSNGGIWRRPLSEMITSVTEKENYIPKGFSLSQNYPNPFNPSTTIRYSLPSSAHVKLTIYNMLGQVVSELVNEEQPAGWKEVRWDASHYPSGVYFYRLEAGNFSDVKKLLLLK